MPPKILTGTILVSARFLCCYFLSILFSSFAINYSFGYGGAKGLDIVFVALILIAVSLYPKLQKLFLTPVLLLLAIYFPVGYLYGQPSLAITASLLQTNHRESIEFFKSMPLYSYALPAIIALAFYLLSKFTWEVHAKPTTKKAYMLVLVIFISALGVRGKLENIKAVNFFTSIANSFSAYSQQIEQLNSGNSNAQWNIAYDNNKKENIVIIIGESMRADYMSVFGYLLPTTPFLDTVKGTFYRNYISTASNTFLSLPRTLALSSGSQVDMSYNVVNLAKQAGFETFWLSNQGMLGDFDLPTSRISTYSDRQNFLKKGDFESLNTDDNELLPLLKNALSTPGSQHKLVVMHIMGSHPQFSDRLNGEKPTFSNPNHDIASYISTYRKTDSFIKSTYEMLTRRNEPFKLIYFSDHGLSKRDINGTFYLRHGSDMKQNYHVPLLVLSDTDTSRQFIDTPKSAYDFISFFAEEAGIQVLEPKLNRWDENAGEMRVFNGNDMVPYSDLGDEPAVTLQ
ncbi:phosphoethanolamine transferase [Enterobacteriaceae bacterium 89]|nr:phosphoethanolamine transferase [Enterobacteriaceae bacterium 89]